MAFEPFTTFTSHTIVMHQENIDTDQIIPARFLTTTSRDGLGKAAFYDWRYTADGAVRNDSPLDDHDTDKFRILVAGSNFGCGSSREHAPWALSDFGFRAVVSSDIADIFKSNSLKNGLLPVVVDRATHKTLLENPGMELTIDLEALTLVGDGLKVSFDVEPFARNCLLQGLDPLGHLMRHLPDIEKYEAAS